MGEFLEFEGWEREEYRHLVEKMIQERFPTLDTQELETTAKLARQFINQNLKIAHHHQRPA